MFALTINRDSHELMNFYYPSADIRINDNINEHIKCTKIIEHLGSEALIHIATVCFSKALRSRKTLPHGVTWHV
jgi:hypothetical protein